MNNLKTQIHKEFDEKEKLTVSNGGFLADVGDDYDPVDFDMDSIKSFIDQSIDKAMADAGMKEYDRDFQTILICALRYALGRTSYITGVVADYIKEQGLTKNTVDTMIKDIEGAKDLGHEMDKEAWLDLLEYLKK